MHTNWKTLQSVAGHYFKPLCKLIQIKVFSCKPCLNIIWLCSFCSCLTLWCTYLVLFMSLYLFYLLHALACPELYPDHTRSVSILSRLVGFNSSQCVNPHWLCSIALDSAGRNTLNQIRKTSIACDKFLTIKLNMTLTFPMWISICVIWEKTITSQHGHRLQKA